MLLFLAKTRGVLLAVLGGVLLGIGFLVPSFWPLALVGIIPLIFIALDDTRSIWRTFRLGFLAGAVLYSFALYGVFLHTLPLDWMGINEEFLQVTFAIISWSLASLGTGLAIGAWAISVRVLATRSWHDIFIIPSLWVLAEVLWSFFMYVQHHGQGNIFGNIDFTLGYIGYQLAEDIALLQTAWLGGVFIMSAIAVGIGTILFRLIHAASNRERRILSILLLIGFCMWVFGHVYFLQHPISESMKEGRTVEVAVLATDIVYTAAPDEQLSIQMELIEKTGGADVVVLPEGAELFKKLELSGLPKPSGAGFYIDSVDVREGDGPLYSRVEYYDPETGTLEHTYKRFLLPIGEFIPYMYLFAGKLLGFEKSETFQKLLREREHAAGPIPRSIETPTGATLGVLFCNEAMSPRSYRSLSRGGAEILVNIASHLWFNRSHTVFTQMKHIGQVRAVENAKWLLIANNTVPALVIDELGRVVAETPWDTPNDVLRIDVPRRTEGTPYTALGVWVLLVPMFLTLLAVCRGLYKKRP